MAKIPRADYAAVGTGREAELDQALFRAAWVEGLDGNEDYIVNGMLRARAGFPVTPQTEAEVAAAEAGQAEAEEN